MQHKAIYLLFCKFTLHVSGANLTHQTGVHKTVTTYSGTGHIFVQLPPSKLAWPRRELAAVTVLCTPDDECG